MKDEALSMSSAGPVMDKRSVRAREPLTLDQVVLALGLMLTFLAYCGTLTFQFVYDDRSQVIFNPWLRSWHFLPRYFTRQVWGFINPSLLGNYYRPLFLLWLRACYVLFGLKPWGWHLASILAHLAVTLLVYYLASRITGDRLTAALAATLFGVHPVHIEAVTWISGVTEPSMAMLFIASFLCHLKSREGGRRSKAWQAASLFLCSAALLEKETALVLPLLIFAYQWIFWPQTADRASSWAGGGRIPNAAWRTLPYLALVPAYLILRSNVLRGLGHSVTDLTLSTIVLTWPSLLWFYVKLLVWPVGLSPCYSTPYVTDPGLLDFFLPAGGLAGVALALGVWAHLAERGAPLLGSESKCRGIAFASAWLITPILPLFNLSVFLKGDIAHDRYMYLPSVGFAILCALALREVAIGRRKFCGQPAAQVLMALGVTILLVVGTLLQSSMWADDLLLYTRGVQVAPRNRNVKMNLGSVACERGLYDAGIKLFKEVIEEHPHFWAAYYNLGYTYYKLGNLKEADRYLSQATEVDLDRPDAFLYLGLTRMKMGRLSEASPLVRHALEVAPEGAPGYHAALGVVLEAQGNLNDALDEFKAELRTNPGQEAARDQIAEIEERLSHQAPIASPSKKSSPPRVW